MSLSYNPQCYSFIVRMESEGRGDKIAVLRLVCFFGSSMYPDDEKSSFFLKCGATKSPRGFSKGVLCVNAEKLKISQNQVITAREVLEPKYLGTLHDLAI